MSRPATLRFEGDRAKALEAIYVTPDVVAQREGCWRRSTRGPGSGCSTSGGAGAAGGGDRGAGRAPTARSTGIDVSPDMLAIAARRALAQGAATLELSEGASRTLTFADGAFDAAVCTQVYEYVEDMPARAAGGGRVLRPGGRLVVLDTDWDSIVWRSSDDARMARVLAAWDAHLVHRGLPRELPELLRAAGSTVGDIAGRAAPERRVRPADLQRRDARPHRRVRDRTRSPEDEVAAWLDDLRTLGDRSFFSLNRYLFTARPALTAAPAMRHLASA